MKKNKKTCLISINSYDELTGGGVYLRTLVNFLLKQNTSLTLVDKKNIVKNFNDQDFDHISFVKNKVTDIISRIFLLPSFYMVYLYSILKICKDKDIIAFHNSRLGIIIYLLKKIFPNKKILLFTDNFEYSLVKQKGDTLVSQLEKFLIKWNEALALKYSDLVSYITVHDKKNMERYYGILKKNSLIIPVTFIRTAGECEYSNEFLLKIKKTQQDCRRKIIFTASFDFFPNIDAANKIIEKAHENPDLLFILAGRKINLLNLPETSNVVLFDSLNNNEMDKLLSGSDIFYSPLVMGSGMKTKIAEALSHGLYIYATRHTMIGYDDVMYDNKCVRVITDANESFPDFIKKSPFDKEYIRSAHNKYYSYDRFSGNELNLFLN